jgi:hypothetical protein
MMKHARSGVLGILAGLAILGHITPLAAQQSPILAPGQRVRVTAPPEGLKRSVALVEAVSARGLALALERNRGRGWIDTLHLTVPLDSLSGVEVSVREYGHGWAGAGLGAVVGALVGYAVGSNKTDMFEPAFSILGGVLLGIPIGAFVGGNVRSDDWRPVDLHTLRVGRLPQAGRRLGLGVALVF